MPFLLFLCLLPLRRLGWRRFRVAPLRGVLGSFGRNLNDLELEVVERLLLRLHGRRIITEEDKLV